MWHVCFIEMCTWKSARWVLNFAICNFYWYPDIPREQVINNVAQIVLEETAPGSLVWLKWRNVLHVVDIVCCCSILMPIMWSIKHLRQVERKI